MWQRWVGTLLGLLLLVEPAFAQTIGVPPYTDAQAAAAAPVQSVNGSTGIVALNVPIYAAGCTPSAPCAIATALADPCNSSSVGNVARVNNLFNVGAATNASMTCVVNGTQYNWHPNIVDFASSQACSGTVTLTPYSSPPTSICTAATLGATLTFNIPSTPTPWCGETFNISTANLTTILGINLNVAGSLLKALGVGGYEAVYTCNGTTGSWVAYP